MFVGFLGTLIAVRRIEPLQTVAHTLNHALLGIDDHPERVAMPVTAGAVPMGRGTPVPVPVVPWAGATRFTVQPGANQLTYTGPPVQLLTLLAPVAAKYSVVRYRAPDGEWSAHRPGAGGR